MTEVGRLYAVLSILEWDQQTQMPPGGAAARAEQIGTIYTIYHEKLTGGQTGMLLEKAASESPAPDSDEAAFIRAARHDYDRATKIPTALAAEVARHAALSEGIWRKARKENDFGSFAPSLKKTVELSRQMAEHYGYQDDIYDALLDGYEPAAKTSEIAAMFADIKPFLIDLTQRIVDKSGGKKATIPGDYPTAKQAEITKKIVAQLGYDFNRGRQDPTTHPFCISFAHGDVRITTRFDESYLQGALYASLHEAGHAMYEQGLPEQWEATPLGEACSMGVHESQSRLWENLVGRSQPFSEWVLPQLKEAFPSALSDCTVDRYWRAVNNVEPSFIRVEADEVTYNLHILLRFELERELLAGRLSVDDLPEAWNARMAEYLGIRPATDSEGVLQDIHWSGGSIGYFPTYTLGNLYGAQLWFAIRRDLPDLDSQIRSGQFADILTWLRDRVHKHGRKYKAADLIAKATGERPTAEPYKKLLSEKFGELYGL